MARINLLPWRQAERERKNREFLVLLASVLLLSLLAAFAAWSYFNDVLDSQRQANEKIKQENASLDKALAEISTLEKQRDEMISRMKVIQDLQGRRPIPVRVWDDIARLIPAQMYLTNMKRDGDVITFKGKADNPDVVAAFIRNLDGSQWLENSAVKSIQQPQATAYPTPPTTPTTTTATPAGGTAQPPRPVYPEDNYVSFEVTTNLAAAQDPASATAGTTANSSTAATVISSTSHTTVNTTVAASTPSANAGLPVSSAAAMPPASVPTNNIANSSVTANRVSTTATTTTVTKETK